jgi:hypothetical protein
VTLTLDRVRSRMELSYYTSYFWADL